MEKQEKLIIVPAVDWVTKMVEIPAEERWIGIGSWYLHGLLEKEFGFDLANTLNCKSCGFIKETINWMEIEGNEVTEVCDEKPMEAIYINGKIDVKVLGADKDCVGYFWTAYNRVIYWQGKEYPYWRQFGLVCFKDDIDGCAYAEEKMNKK